MSYFMSEKNHDELFVLFHGTGGNEYSLLFLTGELNPHASIISFLGENGKGKDRRFFAPLENQQLDVADFQNAVSAFLEEWDRLSLRSTYSKIIFIGYSNGANFIQGILQERPDIADETLLLHPQEFKLTFSKKAEKNQLVITTGANDTLSIPGNILQLKNRLNDSFPEVSFIITDGGHEMIDEEVSQIKTWYQRKA
ncbi:alpha/beta hydrolase [Vagococcus elongatus]|uniref:Phospholipase/carboxylesterase/thioesterase domain-containing protein n=1 Tax=Vagococcus elongatus TaxID=180344 RepID=A0A430B4H0_9ENTE|nr:hypothetical protein [Vagococcus elongatus]RSU15224.1 hypothetical protein CBF29_02505 [Vagococcus elongatus]